MAKELFNAGGMQAPAMVGTPAGTRGSGNGIFPPGTTVVNGFDDAKEFARMSGDQNGSYTPLLRPARRAERLAFPDAPVRVGVSKL